MERIMHGNIKASDYKFSYCVQLFGELLLYFFFVCFGGF